MCNQAYQYGESSCENSHNKVSRSHVVQTSKNRSLLHQREDEAIKRLIKKVKHSNALLVLNFPEMSKRSKYLLF